MSEEPAMKICTCKIGEVSPGILTPGADNPMRKAVEKAYLDLTGQDADFIFSGWGGELTEPEWAVVENREPSAENYKQWCDTRAADLIERLKGYAVHGKACPVRWQQPGDCRCGLTALIKEIEGE